MNDPRETRRATTAWRFACLLHAPYRLTFAAAALMLALSAAWWASLILLAPGGHAIELSLPPGVVHGLLMTFGFMPLFFAGFLFTAGPRWLEQPGVPARSLLAPVCAFTAGWLVFLIAAHGRDAAYGQCVGAIGLGAVAFGWLGLARRFIRLVRTSRSGERLHAGLIATAAVFGALAMCANAWAVAAADDRLERAATGAALWAFIGLTFVSAAHRLVPFLSTAHRLLGGLVGLCLFEAITAAAEPFGRLHDTAWLAVRAAAELCAGAALLGLSLRWAGTQNLRVRLIAMLHAGFSWLGVSVLLAGASHAMMAGGDAAGLALAPLHAYTMGFLGSTLIAMVTRITCGHSGRTTTADDFLWRLFWVLQLSIAARLAAAVLAPVNPALGSALLASAAIGWASVCVAWAVRYGAWYGRPRADGRPG